MAAPSWRSWAKPFCGHYDVVKQAEGTGGQHRIPFGRTDMQPLRMCPYPLWIVNLGHVRRTRNIMVAIDPVPEDIEQNALAEKLLNPGALVAEAAQATLHVSPAWRSAGETTLRDRALSSAQIDRLVMGTIGRTGISCFFIGNTAETVL